MTAPLIPAHPLSSTTPIGDFLSAAAAKVAVPGGGAVAALAGASACSMAEMVVAYSLGRKGLEAHTEALSVAARKLVHARALLLQLMEEDQHAYLALSASWKLPDADPDSAASKAQAASLALAVPQEIAATALAVLETAASVAPMGNVNLLSDLAVAFDLGSAAVSSAVHNVRVNLKSNPPGPERDRLEAQCQAWQATAARLASEGVSTVRSRAGF